MSGNVKELEYRVKELERQKSDLIDFIDRYLTMLLGEFDTRIKALEEKQTKNKKRRTAETVG